MKSPYKNKFKVSQQFKGSAHDGLDLVGVDSKEIYSTVDGVVEKAGWENPENHRQGFGLYVRIRKEGSIDKYYFGHLSAIKVKAGQAVLEGDLLGIEGSTGKSTGSHCHYCARGNGSPALIRDICAISGIPNKLGIYENSIPQKTVTELAKEVINGIWGNGAERKKKLTEAGYSYAEVQAEVNRLAKAGSDKKATINLKTNQEIAEEVIKGLWGNGEERRKKLTEAGYDYKKVQALVNKLV